MWSDIQFDPKQVSGYLRHRCENLDFSGYDKALFREMEDARHAYGSLKNEGNTLTFVETSMVLKGEVPDNCKNRDLLETIALAAALKEVRYLVDSEPFSENVAKRIHKTCANGLLHVDECGEYRKRANAIGRGNYLTAAPNQIQKLINRLFEVCSVETNAVVKAAFFSFNFLSIHPFIDFNGRTSRLYECYILGEAGLPFISLREDNMKEYLNLLQEGQERGKPYFEPYVEFILKRLEERMEEINPPSGEVKKMNNF